MVKPQWEPLSLGAVVLCARRVANPSARHRTSLNHDCNSRGAESLLALRNEGRCVKGSGFDVPFDGWLTLQPHTSRQPKAPMEFAGAAFFAFFFSAKGATLAAPATLCWRLGECVRKSPGHAPAPAPASSVSAGPTSLAEDRSFGLSFSPPSLLQGRDTESPVRSARGKTPFVRYNSRTAERVRHPREFQSCLSEVWCHAEGRAARRFCSSILFAYGSIIRLRALVYPRILLTRTLADDITAE